MSEKKNSYFDSLDNISKSRYLAKLQTLDLKNCLYEISDDEWIDVVQSWPCVARPDVHEYLINTKGQFTNMALKAYKSLEYNFFQSGWVQTIFILNSTIRTDVALFRCKATPSQSTTEKPHQVWTAVKKDRSVAADHCNCMSG